jgi:hypothetical protein
MTAWQPMETLEAGQHVLCYTASKWYQIGWSANNVDKVCAYDPDALDSGNYIRINATHWMLLPAPPPISGAGQNEEGR